MKTNKIASLFPLSGKILSGIFIISLLINSSTSNAQGLPRYPMKFQYNTNGRFVDTTFSKAYFRTWTRTAKFPGYAKWDNLPLAVANSSVSGVGLFCDSSSTFSRGDTIGFAFYKSGSTGTFSLDYIESNLGTFVNNSSAPNMNIVKTSRGLMMVANCSIKSGTELTASYQSLINFFPNDATAREQIKYW